MTATARWPAFRPHRLLALLATALVAVGFLSGCGSVRSGVAAQVGDTTITVHDLDAQVSGYLAASGQRGLSGDSLANAQAKILDQLILDQLMAIVAAEHGVTVGSSDVDKVAAQITAMDPAQKQQFYTQNFLSPAMVPAVARTSLEGNALGAKLLGDTPTTADQVDKANTLLVRELTQAVQNTHLAVNPRYGSWKGVQLDPQGGLLVPVTGVS